MGVVVQLGLTSSPLFVPSTSPFPFPFASLPPTLWLQQPFSAFLLKARPRNEYKRVASICHILARPTDSAGVLKGEVTTVTIVQWCVRFDMHFVRRLLYGQSH